MRHGIEPVALAQSKTSYHLGQQGINANAQITYPQGQPDVREWTGL